MIEKAILLLSGNAAASLLLLTRNLLVARLIPVADYGVAATFAILMAGVEMASELGLKQQIVQSRDGENPRFQAALQTFQLLRGIVAGAVLFLLAGPLAAFFGIPEVAWAYQILAIVPVLKAAEHFDIHRLNRQMRFGPMLWSGVIPAAVALALVWPLALWLGDWRVMLWSLVVQAVLTMVVSHLLAERRYSLAWDTAIMAGSLRFGWPLMINAILLFAVFQGDKLIVGNLLGIETLAIFAMGVTLMLTPTQVLAKSAQKFFLPQLTRAAADESRFKYLARVTFLTHILFGGCLVSAALIFGNFFITILLGEKYSELALILIFIAIVQGVHIFKGGPSNVALARAQTANSLISNIARILLLPVAWLLVSQVNDVMIVIVLAFLGEAVGALVSFALVRWRLCITLSGIRWPTFLVISSFIFAALFGIDQIYQEFILVPNIWLAAVSVMLQISALVSAGFLWRRLRLNDN